MHIYPFILVLITAAIFSVPNIQGHECLCADMSEIVCAAGQAPVDFDHLPCQHSAVKITNYSFKLCIYNITNFDQLWALKTINTTIGDVCPCHCPHASVYTLVGCTCVTAIGPVEPTNTPPPPIANDYGRNVALISTACVLGLLLCILIALFRAHKLQNCPEAVCVCKTDTIVYCPPKSDPWFLKELVCTQTAQQLISETELLCSVKDLDKTLPQLRTITNLCEQECYCILHLDIIIHGCALEFEHRPKPVTKSALKIDRYYPAYTSSTTYTEDEQESCPKCFTIAELLQLLALVVLLYAIASLICSTRHYNLFTDYLDRIFSRFFPGVRTYFKNLPQHTSSTHNAAPLANAQVDQLRHLGQLIERSVQHIEATARPDAADRSAAANEIQLLRQEFRNLGLSPLLIMNKAEDLAPIIQEMSQQDSVVQEEEEEAADLNETPNGIPSEAARHSVENAATKLSSQPTDADVDLKLSVKLKQATDPDHAQSDNNETVIFTDQDDVIGSSMGNKNDELKWLNRELFRFVEKWAKAKLNVQVSFVLNYLFKLFNTKYLTGPDLVNIAKRLNIEMGYTLKPDVAKMIVCQIVKDFIEQ